MIKIALQIGRDLSEERLQLAKQYGVDEIVGSAPMDYYEGYMYGTAPQDVTSLPEVWEFEKLVQMKKRIEDAGLKISIIDAAPPIDLVKAGLPGRDKQIKNFCTSIRNMGAAGIPRITFNFTPLRTTRTSTTTRTRGGAQVTSFDMKLMKNAPHTDYGKISKEKMFDNWEYFIKKVIPVAEEADVRLAVHPDDPPVPNLRGIGRPFTSFEGFKRITEVVDSEYNGISFCMGCWAEMGENVPEAIRYFGKRKKINFVHFRDIKGVATKFAEAFHDDGQSDLLANLRALKDVGYDGPMRPDHQARSAGYDTLPPNSGYKLMGKFFAIGYLKGLMEAIYGKSPSTPLLM
jgi:mannonate dehydratase